MKLFNIAEKLRVVCQRNGTMLLVLCQAGSFAVVFAMLVGVLFTVAKSSIEPVLRLAHDEPPMYVELGIFAAVILIVLSNLWSLSSIIADGVRSSIARRLESAGVER